MVNLLNVVFITLPFSLTPALSRGERGKDIGGAMGEGNGASGCFLKMTAHPLPAAQIDPGGRLFVAARGRLRTARRETAAGRHLREWRHLAADRRQGRAAPADIRERGEEFLCVGMARTGEETFARRFFDDLPGVHHADALRHLRHHAQIVGDQQHPHAAFGLQAAQEIENLRLDGDIKRGRRLVGDQQARLARERHGDHHPLLHAAGKLKRIFDQTARRIGDADRLQEFQRPRLRRRADQPAMLLQHFADLPADGQHRVEAGGRLLKDHRHAAAAHLAHAGFRELHKLLAVKMHCTAEDAPGGGQEPQQRERRRRFAAAGFAQKRQRFSRRQIEADAVNRREHLPSGGKAGFEIGDFQHIDSAWGAPVSGPEALDAVLQRMRQADQRLGALAGFGGNGMRALDADSDLLDAPGNVVAG